MRLDRITPTLWFDRQAEEAARFYCELFPDSRILAISHYGGAGREVHGQSEGTVMTVAFELAGQSFMAFNGGPLHHFTPALSLQVRCESQDEIDRYWAALAEGGDPNAQACGWLKDRYGLSWQVVPAELATLVSASEGARGERVMNALLRMKKLDLAALRSA
jgi:predicted 3-demethylubiquinone-9 3-methyltransferase (glyoxalase superfamily)